MKRQIIILLLAWSGLLGAWALANPPDGVIGATAGKISTDGSGNIGIGTSTPMAALDVNGTTTIRKSLDMANSPIINLAMPSLNGDAVPLNYISINILTVSSSTTRLWGQGRPGATVVSATGQCTNTIGGQTIKISKSSFAATWDKAAAACPANWWVCTTTERDRNGATAGYGTCPASGAVVNNINDCLPSYDSNPGSVDDIFIPSIKNDVVWVSDATTSATIAHIGVAVSTAGTNNTHYVCASAPVWCCSY